MDKTLQRDVVQLHFNTVNYGTLLKSKQSSQHNIIFLILRCICMSTAIYLDNYKTS